MKAWPEYVRKVLGMSNFFWVSQSKEDGQKVQISNYHSFLGSKLQLSKFVHLVCPLLELRKQNSLIFRYICQDLVFGAILHPDQGNLKGY